VFEETWWELPDPLVPGSEEGESRPTQRRRLNPNTAAANPTGLTGVTATDHLETGVDAFNPLTLSDTHQAVYALATIRESCDNPTGEMLMSIFRTLLLGRQPVVPEAGDALQIQTHFHAKKKYMARKQSFGLMPQYLDKYVPEGNASQRGNRKEQLVYHILGVPRRMIPRIVEGSINVPGAVALLEAMCRHDPELFRIPDILQLR
jgi:hypothetical protein